MRSVSLFVLSAVLLSAQSFQGSLRGRVVDPNGASVPVAKITIVDEGTSISRSTLTSNEGEYTFASLTPATYSVLAETPGFKRLERKGVVVSTQSSVTVDLALEIGQVTEQIKVRNHLTHPRVRRIIVSMEAPKTLMEAIKYFSDPDRTLQFFVAYRWPKGVECPYCEAKEPMFLATRRIWKCRKCRKQFSVKIGTIFNESPIGLDKWMTAAWLIANCKNGVSSYEIARDLGVTQKTAWFMLQRLRLALQDDDGGKLSGEVEVDETFIGGKARNMHVEKRKRRITGTGTKDKTAVIGIIERGGRVRAAVVPNRRKSALQHQVRKHVQAGSALYTDALLSYEGLAGEYAHQVIDHAVSYVDGAVHTNTLENFWSLLKRGIAGTYVSVEPFHLFRYLDEQAFRYNERELNDSQRFSIVCKRIAGRRLTWNKLTGKEPTPTE